MAITNITGKIQIVIYGNDVRRQSQGRNAMDAF
jgi:hypothetical protein